jgi:hypothetical protein
MEQRGRRLTDAFVAALELRKHLREGTAFCEALTDLKLQIETLEDGYPEWHPASYPFHGMLKFFVYSACHRILLIPIEATEVIGKDYARNNGECTLAIRKQVSSISKTMEVNQ